MQDLERQVALATSRAWTHLTTSPGRRLYLYEVDGRLVVANPEQEPRSGRILTPEAIPSDREKPQLAAWIHAAARQA